MKYYITLVLSILFVEATAQQDPLYAQYMNNPFLLNPAYAGFRNCLNASVGYRQQWSGMEGPKTFNVTTDMSVLRDRAGVGLASITDRIGATSRTEIMAAYAYKIPLSANTMLSFGLQGGVIQYKVDHSELAILDRDDPLFEGNEIIWKPNMGAGFVVSNDRFFAGVSVPRLLQSSNTIGSMDQTLISRHYYVTGAYLFPVSPAVVFKPSVLLRYVSGAPVSADVNAGFIFHERLQAGVFTRNLNTLGGLLQITMKDSFRLGYVFEMPTGKALTSNFVTHELTVTLCMNVLSFHESSSMKGL